MSKRDSKVEGLINGCMDNCVQLGGEISDLRCNVQASTARQEEKIRRLIEEARPINETVKELQEKFRRGDLENTVGRTSEVLRGLSSRLDHLESRMAGQLDRLSKYSQQTLEERISQTQTQPSGSQESRLQDLENTIHELKNTIRSPKTVARLEQDIRRVQGEVGQCLEEVVNCRSENKGSLNKMRDGIARLEEDFRRTTSETRSKIDFLETKVGTVHDRVRGLEKSEASAKSGIRRTEHKIENVEILVEQVAAACNATVKAVDQKHLRFKNSLRVIKEAAAVTNAKCDALAEAMAKLHKDTVGKTDDKLRETRDSNTRDAPNKAQECHHDREYLAHVTVERTGKERKPGDARKHQYLVKDKGPILQTPGARTVEVIPSKPPVHR
ncbi:hypothetical protein BSKO_01404 [Bryopsis sp. KO-2023]|nr:hypothetical protein BSKO_01404 [Bryopsis sp. KO-2023]